MSCIRCHTTELNQKIVTKFHNIEQDLVEVARRMLRTAGDPLSAIIRFLHERPEDASLTGYVMHYVLKEAFGTEEMVPESVRILAKHVREIIRHANVIDVINEHPAVERWGNYLIKQKERIRFEIAREKERLVLKNIVGLIAIENNFELPVDKITVQPPKLIVTVRFGILRPERVLDMV